MVSMSAQFQYKPVPLFGKKLNDNNFSKQLREDLDNFNIDENLRNFSHNKNINIKRVIYRSITLFVSALGRLHGIRENSGFGIIDILQRQRKLSENAASRLTHAVAVACHVRLVHYASQNRQEDIISKENEKMGGGEKLKELSKIVHYKSLVKCLVTTFVLQKLLMLDCDISDFDQLFLKDEDVFQVKIFNALGLMREGIIAGERFCMNHGVQSPNSCYVLVHLLNSYMLIGQFEKCLELSEKFFAFLPSTPDYSYVYAVAKILEASALHYLGRYLLSVNTSNALLKTDMIPYNRFGCLHINSHSKYALKQYHEALSACRDSRKLLLQMGIGFTTTLHSGIYQIASLSLVEIGRRQQALNRAREGLNLMVKIQATGNYVRGFKQIIKYIIFYDTHNPAYRKMQSISTNTPLQYIQKYV